MFRKPMRLEKWIAFDGAVGADVLTLVQDAAPDAADNADNQDNTPDVEAFTFVAAESEAVTTGFTLSDNTMNLPGGGSLTITISGEPITKIESPDGDSLFVFRGGNIGATIDSINSGNSESGKISIVLSDPGNGDFGLLPKDQIDGAFLAANEGKTIAFIEDGMVKFRTVSGGSLQGWDGSNPSMSPILASISGSGGITITLTTVNDNTFIDNAITALLQSLVFKPDSGNSPATVGDFNLNISYAGESDGIHAAIDDPDDNGDEGGNDEGGGGNPPPTEDIIIPPPPPPPPGGDDGGGESGGGETGGGEGESGNEGDSGGDADSGDAAGGDDLNYVFHEDDSEDADDSDGEAESARNDNGPEQTEVEVVVALEDRTMESAAAVTAVELAREVEYLLTSVRSERDVLLNSLSRLQEEYLRKSGKTLDEDFRALLRRLFESGNREKEALNRIISEMNRQMDIYRTLAPGLRDGMLTESLRELVDSAERRTGETGALSQAIDAVVRMISGEGELPEAEEVYAMFEKTYADALQQWQEQADLSDPMGKELAVTEREAIAAN